MVAVNRTITGLGLDGKKIHCFASRISMSWEYRHESPTANGVSEVRAAVKWAAPPWLRPFLFPWPSPNWGSTSYHAGNPCKTDAACSNLVAQIDWQIIKNRSSSKGSSSAETSPMAGGRMQRSRARIEEVSPETPSGVFRSPTRQEGFSARGLSFANGHGVPDIITDTGSEPSSGDQNRWWSAASCIVVLCCNYLSVWAKAISSLGRVQRKWGKKFRWQVLTSAVQCRRLGLFVWLSTAKQDWASIQVIPIGHCLGCRPYSKPQLVAFIAAAHESGSICVEDWQLLCRYNDLLFRTSHLEDRAEDYQVWQESFSRESGMAMAKLNQLESVMNETR